MAQPPSALVRRFWPLILLVFGFAVVGFWSEVNKADPVDQGTVVRVWKLQAGECVLDPSAGLPSKFAQVKVVPCGEPHDWEIFSVNFYAGHAAEDYPGVRTLHRFAEGSCVDEVVFTEYVGTRYRASVLGIGTIVPTVESWAEGDRDLLCYVWHPDGKLNHSVRGSGR